MGLALTKNYALALCTIIALAFLWPTAAQAQVAPCPYGGPSPGYRVVGQTPAGNGVGSILLCEPTGEAQPQQQQQRPPPPSRPTYLKDAFYAVVTHPDANDVWAAYQYYNLADAKKDSLANCTKMMGAGCNIAVSGMNEDVTIYDVNDGSLRWSVGHRQYDEVPKFLADCLAEGKRCYKKSNIRSYKLVNFVDLPEYDLREP